MAKGISRSDFRFIAKFAEFWLVVFLIAVGFGLGYWYGIT